MRRLLLCCCLAVAGCASPCDFDEAVVEAAGPEAQDCGDARGSSDVADLRACVLAAVQDGQSAFAIWDRRAVLDPLDYDPDAPSGNLDEALAYDGLDAVYLQQAVDCGGGACIAATWCRRAATADGQGAESPVAHLAYAEDAGSAEPHCP